MNTVRTVLSLALIAVLVGVAGCKGTTGGASSGKATHVYADPSFTTPESLRLPMVGWTNTSTEAEAPQYFFTHLEEALREKPQYTVLSIWAVEREVRRKKLSDQYDTLKEQWRDQRGFDPATLREFGAAMGVTHVMAGEVSEWQSEKVDINVEGYSHSDVAASLKIFDVNTGAVVWEARDRFELKSAYYDPALGAAHTDDLGIVRGESRIVPEAPPIDDAAVRVANNLVASLP